MYLQVIVGVGRHSVGGVARILPAVVHYLTDAGYSFREEPNNPGVFMYLLTFVLHCTRICTHCQTSRQSISSHEFSVVRLVIVVNLAQVSSMCFFLANAMPWVDSSA
jgi:hypothetical protein